MKNRQAGLTLIEVLIALVVVGLAAGATASGLRATTNLLGENELHAKAITLAQKVIEDVRTVPYEDITSGSAASEDDLFLVTWEVSANTPERGMTFIAVKTTWEWKGAPRSYELYSVFSRITRS